jgi:hypothetical protein
MLKLTCSKCRREKLSSEFDKDATKASGFRSQCKTCRRAPVLTPTQLSDQEQRQKANRNALLRLVHNHRAEFEALVNGELIRVKAESEGMSAEKAWQALA